MLITPGQQWPPPGHWGMRTRWTSWAAWWSGDLTRLMADTPATAPGGYWQRRNKEGTTKIHTPLAADMARTMGELMYGDAPKLTFEGDQVQEAWEDLAREMGWGNQLLESGEIGAALGGSFLRPGWDEATADHPLPFVSRPDMALPEFRFGRLNSVTFVTELAPPNDWTTRETGEVWRWLEHNEPGQIRHELWLGSASNVGTPMPLTDHPHTANLEPVIDTTGIRERGILVEYIPHDLPQPLDTDPHGRSVLQGVETLLDQLDEAWDSWMRDIRLGKGRIFLSSELLSPVGAAKPGLMSRLTGRGQPAQAFDVDGEAFVPTSSPDVVPDGQTPTPITSVQLAIRLAEHQGTVLALIEDIVSRQGFDPQTFGLHVEGQQSGTSLRIRNQRSYRTRDRGHRYARTPLERFAETLMLVNAALFGGPKPTTRPKLEWPDASMDPKDVAEIADLLNRAQAASTRVRVALVHPDWDATQVDDEVALITAENAVAPVLTGFEGDDPTAPGITPEQANTFGILIRSGVEPEDAARQAGIGSVDMIPGATPVTIAIADDDPATPAAPGPVTPPGPVAPPSP